MFRIFNQYVSAKSFLLMVVEGLLIVLSLICAVKLRFWNWRSVITVMIPIASNVSAKNPFLLKRSPKKRVAMSTVKTISPLESNAASEAEVSCRPTK